MIQPRRWLAALALATAPMVFAACSDDDDTNPTVAPATNLTATALGSNRARVQFDASSDADGYIVERAPGATGGTFAQVATPDQPTGATRVTFEDTGLQAEQTYRYRVAAVRGTLRSSWTSEASITTPALGAAAAVISADITANRTLYADTTYTLRGFVHVLEGATLTIQPGTRIVGDFNTVGSSLFILRGARIQAIGTAQNPIVFTSSQPAGQRRPGDWGGLVIVGRASLSRTGVDINIEGTGTAPGGGSGENYFVPYSGGTRDDDDSGELRYVRVEFAGYAPSNGNELNAFTFAALGSGTKLSYLQSMAGLDDSFEWFGGTADAHHLVSYESGDDHFDMSEGFRGRLQYLIAYQDTVLPQRQGAGTPSGDPQGIENDGCSGSGCASGEATMPLTQPVVANFTLVGTGKTALSGGSGGVGLFLRRGVAGHYVNGIIARYPRAAISVRDSSTYNRAGATAVQDLATADLAIRNVLVVESPTIFQAASGSTVQNSLDLAGNAITQNTTLALAQLFGAFPGDATAATTAAAFDWRPQAGSAAATGGLTTFSGRLQTRTAGSTVAGTSYLGAAAPGGEQWWAGWTVYTQQ